MYTDDSTDFLAAGILSCSETDFHLIGKLLRFSDGSRARLLSIIDTPRDRWLNLRPGGWVPLSDLAER